MNLTLLLRIAAVVLIVFALICAVGSGTFLTVGRDGWLIAAALAVFLERLLAVWPATAK